MSELLYGVGVAGSVFSLETHKQIRSPEVCTAPLIHRNTALLTQSIAELWVPPSREVVIRDTLYLDKEKRIQSTYITASECYVRRAEELLLLETEFELQQKPREYLSLLTPGMPYVTAWKKAAPFPVKSTSAFPVFDDTLSDMADTKDTNGTVPNNENQTTVGVMNLHTKPEGRRPGTMDALWGDEPSKELNGAGVVREGNDDRRGLLGRIFDSLESANAEAKAEMAERFQHVASHEYEAHSPLLQREKTAAAVLVDEHSPEEGSLTDRVVRIAGRR